MRLPVYSGKTIAAAKIFSLQTGSLRDAIHFSTGKNLVSRSAFLLDVKTSAGVIAFKSRRFFYRLNLNRAILSADKAWVETSRATRAR